MELERAHPPQRAVAQGEMMPARHQGVKTRKIEDDRAGILMDLRDQPRGALNGRGDGRQADS